MLVELWNAGQGIDFITLTQVLRNRKLLDKVGGASFVTHLFDFVPTAVLVGYYLEIVCDKYLLRSLAAFGSECTRLAQDSQVNPGELLSRARNDLDKLHGQKGDGTLERPLIEFRSPLELKGFTPPPGLVLAGDFHVVKGSVDVIGGAPGVGKSRAATALAEAGATGHDWFGLEVNRRFKTMIVQTENGEFRLSKEFADLDCESLNDYIRVCPPPPYGLCFGRTVFREQLAAAIADFAPDVVVFDPWNAAAREQDSREYLDTLTR